MCQALGRINTPEFAVNTPSATEEVSCAVHNFGPLALKLTAAVTVLFTTLLRGRIEWGGHMSAFRSCQTESDCHFY